jgi:hypothetical protein
MVQASPEQRKRIEVIHFPPPNPARELKSAATAFAWVFDFFLVSASTDGVLDENGLSLLQKWRLAPGRPTTILVSSALEKAIGEPPGPMLRRHVVAQKHGVEWMGEKSTDKAKETIRQIVELADAAALIGDTLKPAVAEGQLFGAYEAEQLCFDVLRAPQGTDWANSAQRQIDRARPPREVPTASKPATARSIIGWLLGHVLPYPSFLLTDAQAALRLRVEPESFRSIVTAFNGLKVHDGYRSLFVLCQYRGPLASFFGRRWWRAAIDDFAWQLSQDQEGFRPAFQRLSGKTNLSWLDQTEPVLLSTADLVETDEVAESKDCVRVVDEDFPANVDAAWVPIKMAREDKLLAAKVVYEDRELLSVSE